MAASEISVASEALTLISRSPIQSFDEKSPEAAICKTLFPSAKRTVLGAYDWPHCRVVRELVLAEGVDTRGWDYAYVLPGDYVELWRVGDQRLKSDPSLKSLPYEFGFNLSLSDDHVYVFTNQNPAYARYGTERVPMGRLPPYLTDLIAVNLASRLAMPLRRDAKLMQALEQKYKLDLSAAETRAANNEPEIIEPDYVPELISVRRQ